MSLAADEHLSRQNCQFQGLSEFSATGAWTTASDVQIQLTLPEKVDSDAELMIAAHPMLTGKCPVQRLYLEVDGIKAGEVTFTAPGEKRFILPEAAVGGKKNFSVRLYLPNAVVPSGFEHVPGSARLGLYIRRMELKY